MWGLWVVVCGVVIVGCTEKDAPSTASEEEWGASDDDGAASESLDGEGGMGSGAPTEEGGETSDGSMEDEGSTPSDDDANDAGSESGVDDDGAEHDTGEGEVSDDAEDGEEGTPTGLPVLGSGSASVDAVDFRSVGDASDGMNTPRDLAFNPDVANELWVVNRADDSVSVFSDVGTSEQSSQHIVDPYAMHFMDEVAAIAFGAAMHAPTSSPNFATCQESTNTYGGELEPNYFMGPTLWSSDLDIFGKSNPEAVSFLSEMFGRYVDLGSHLDMLHESPLCVGIEHEVDNVYWVFDGYNESIVRYDFQEDHGPGFDDHDDGIMARYVEGRVAYSPDVPSHMVLDPIAGLLYIADTGNNRIAVLDTESGERGADLERVEPGTVHYEMVGATLSTFIDGEDVGLVAPSGIEIIDGILFVTDNETSEIIAFDADGMEIDRLDTRLAPGSLMPPDSESEGLPKLPRRTASARCGSPFAPS